MNVTIESILDDTEQALNAEEADLATRRSFFEELADRLTTVSTDVVPSEILEALGLPDGTELDQVLHSIKEICRQVQDAGTVFRSQGDQLQELRAQVQEAKDQLVVLQAERDTWQQRKAPGIAPARKLTLLEAKGIVKASTGQAIDRLLVDTVNRGMPDLTVPDFTDLLRKYSAARTTHGTRWWTAADHVLSNEHAIQLLVDLYNAVE